MGELRDNPYSQGIWARVFAGQQTSDYGLSQVSTYTTIQAGYDYKFGLDDAGNYLGIALSYTNSSSTQAASSYSNPTMGTYTNGVSSAHTNGVEATIYNSYIADSGFYSDSLVKFGYYSSDVNMFAQTETYNTSNFALAFSEEVGYRFKLGSENEWFIDPQAEVAFAYMTKGDFTQSLNGYTMAATQDATSMLRARLGAAWGYKFDHLMSKSDMKASVYLGTYYAYDYFIGGDTTLDASTIISGVNAQYILNALKSNGRFVANVGTNIEVKDNTRIYFDFEKSFGSTVQTDYQVSLGVRFGIGEKASAPKQEKKANETSLKPKELEESAE